MSGSIAINAKNSVPAVVAAFGSKVCECRIGERARVETNVDGGRCACRRQTMCVCCLNYGLNCGEVSEGRRPNRFTSDSGFREHQVSNTNTSVWAPDDMRDDDAALVVAGSAMFGLIELWCYR